MPKNLTLLLPVVASLVLVACGGEDAPTREEFAREADRVCESVEQATEEIQRPETPEELVSYTNEVERTLDDAVRRINELEVPEGDAGEQADSFKQALESDANDTLKPALQELREAAESGDAAAIRRAGQEIEDADTSESDRLAEQVGAQECAS